MENALRKINNIILAVVVLVPLVFIPIEAIEDFFYRPKVFALLILGITYLMILFKNTNYLNQLLEFDNTNILLLIYFMFLVISVFVAENLEFALKGSPFREEGIVTIILYMLLFLAARSIRLKDDKIFKCILLSATIVATYGILQYHGIDIFPRDFIRKDWKAAFSTMGNQNFLGTYLVLTIPIAMHLFIIKKKNYAGVVFGLLFYCLLATMTRGSWIGGFVAIILYLVLIRVYYANYKELRYRMAILVGLSVSIIFVFSLQSGETFLDRIFSISRDAKASIEGGEDANMAGSGRVFIWKGVIELIKQRPWFGFGLENLAEPFYRMNEEVILKMFGGPAIIDKAHNEYLHIAVTAGIPALITYMLFIGSNLKRGIKRLKLEVIVIPLMASITGYLVQALFNFSVVSVAYMFWIFLGLLAGRTKLETQES